MTLLDSTGSKLDTFINSIFYAKLYGSLLFSNKIKW